ncbi:hypothetical protein C2138_05040 [Salinibacterium hongtaonis]|nr:hypothetical protein C2138_05040 [Salinibacterium hongtaonis]
MVVSTGALMSTHLRRIRIVNVLLWLLLVIEVALLATLAFSEVASPLRWTPLLLVLIAGANVVFWTWAAMQSLVAPREDI